MQPGLSSPRRISLLFVDDNVLAAQALERFLDGRPDIGLAGWCASADEALEHVEHDKPDVVLLDLDMPGVDTLALIPHLQQLHSDVQVVIFSGHCRTMDIERSLDAGAAGYVCKDESTQTVVDLIVRAVGGECVLSPMAERVFLA